MRNLEESGESGKLPLKFVGFAKFARPPSKLNSTAISENLPLRRSTKVKLGKAVLNKVGSDLRSQTFLGKKNLDPPKFFQPKKGKDTEGKKIPQVNYNTGFERRVHDIFKNSLRLGSGARVRSGARDFDFSKRGFSGGQLLQSLSREKISKVITGGPGSISQEK